MPKAILDRCWSYAEGDHARAYGPGETEIPDGLYEILSSKGYLDSSIQETRSLEDLDGVGSDLAKRLKAAGYQTPEDLHAASDDELIAIDGIGPKKLRDIRAAMS